MAQIPQNSFQGPLAPKYGLNEDLRNTIPGGPNVNIPKKRNFSRLLPVGALAIALLILPLTISQLGQQQDVRQNASGPEPTIVFPTSVIGSPTPVVSLTPVISTPSASVKIE